MFAQHPAFNSKVLHGVFKSSALLPVLLGAKVMSSNFWVALKKYFIYLYEKQQKVKDF